MNVKRVILACCLYTVVVLNVQAQATYRNSFDSIRIERWKTFNEARMTALRNYAATVRQTWQEFKGEPAEQVPEEEQVLPVLLDDDGHETAGFWNDVKALFKEIGKMIPRQSHLKPVKGQGEVLQVGKELPPPVVAEQPKPIFKPVEVPRETQRPNAYRSYDLYGLTCKIRIGENCQLHLEGLSSNQVADAMKAFEMPQFHNMLYDCLQVRKQHHLSDWAYYLLLQKVVDDFYGKNSNEAALALSFLYSQSGYRMRMVHDRTRLMMLAACSQNIYGKDFTYADYPNTNSRYYLLDGRRLASSICICQAKWPKESNMSLQLTEEQEFALNKAPQRTIRSRKNADFAFTITSNKNYMDFYGSYPSSCIGDNFMTRWQMYAETPLERGVRDQLYPAMREKLQGMSKVEAVCQLLWWTQGYLDDQRTNSHPDYFQYAYDENVWGTDRAFFGEETLFYPWCDCEDRAILFSHLVRDLVGLDVALVYYPGHLAAAVAFPETVVGDYYITADGRHFTVCDPTILGGNIGQTMDCVVGKPATLMVLKRQSE